MGLEGSLLYSQEPATDPYPNPVQPLTPSFHKIHFNINIRYNLALSSGLLPSGFMTNIICTSHLPKHTTCPTHLIHFDFMALIIFPDQEPHNAITKIIHTVVPWIKKIK